MPIDDQPLSRSDGPIHRAAVDVAAEDGDTAVDLLLDQLDVSGLHRPGCYAEIGDGTQLGTGIGGVAIALHFCQVLVVAIGTLERAGLDVHHDHGAARREAVPGT